MYSAQSLVTHVKARFKLCKLPNEPLFKTWIKSSSYNKIEHLTV